MLHSHPTITLIGDVTGSGAKTITTAITPGMVLYATMQNVSATDKVIGRKTAGSGPVEEIQCTLAGRNLLDDLDATAQRATLGINSNIVVYKNQNVKASPKKWNGSAVTASGVATFYPTSDNTASGTAIFSNIDGAWPSAETNTSSAVGVPSATIKLIAADKKSITVNVVIGRTLLALGATQAFAPDGTNVYLKISGD